MNNKVLVCITIQENSRRLISKGHEFATKEDAELHILHIRKGDTIFDHADSSNLLENLFAYGSELGGEVHFLSSNNVPETISNFIIDNHISHIILGEAPTNIALENNIGIFDQLKDTLSEIEVTVIPREEK